MAKAKKAVSPRSALKSGVNITPAFRLVNLQKRDSGFSHDSAIV
jgi:hypothetical protein